MPEHFKVVCTMQGAIQVLCLPFITFYLHLYLTVDYSKCH